MKTKKMAMIGLCFLVAVFSLQTSAKTKETAADREFDNATPVADLFASQSATLKIIAPLRMPLDADKNIAKVELSHNRISCTLSKVHNIDVVLGANRTWKMRNVDPHKSLVSENAYDAEATNQGNEIRIYCEEDQKPLRSSALTGIPTEEVLKWRDQCAKAKGEFKILDEPPAYHLADRVYPAGTNFAQCLRKDTSATYSDVKKAFKKKGIEIEFIKDSPRTLGAKAPVAPRAQSVGSQ